MFCLAKFSPWKKNLETSLFEISCYQWNHGEAEDVTFIKSVSLLGTRREFTNMTKLSNLNQLYLIFLELSHFVDLAFDHFVISCVQNCLYFSWICQSSCHPDHFKKEGEFVHKLYILRIFFQINFMLFKVIPVR